VNVPLTFGRSAKTGAALFLAVGAIGFMGSVAWAGGHAASGHSRSGGGPAVLHGHKCTVVASGRHRHVVGHAGDVVCGVRGNDTLTAVGPGTVYLIAGRGRDTLVASNDPNAHDVLIGGSGRDTLIAGSSGDDIIEEGSGTDTVNCGGATVTVVSDDTQGNDDGTGPGTGNSGEGDASRNTGTTGTGNTGNTGEGDNGQGQDCQGNGNDQNAAQAWEGTITALPTSTTMTVQWADVDSGAQTWLAANGNPTTVTFDLTGATVQVDGGGALAVGDDVEVAANPPATGTTLRAVDVQASAGDGSD
jgi:hypothetical protein